jgi:hypothetical protein
VFSVSPSTVYLLGDHNRFFVMHKAMCHQNLEGTYEIAILQRHTFIKRNNMYDSYGVYELFCTFIRYDQNPEARNGTVTLLPAIEVNVCTEPSHGFLFYQMRKLSS